MTLTTLLLFLFISFTTYAFPSEIRRPSNYPRFQVKECEPDLPCDYNSTDLEPLNPVIAREIAFGDITAEFISSYAVEFADAQATAGVGGDWVNIGMTSPTAEGPVNEGADSYIESGRIRYVIVLFVSINVIKDP